MVYEQCLADKNTTLLSTFGSKENIPNELPLPGTILNVSTEMGSWKNIVMPELPECDLQKELDNVSSISEVSNIHSRETLSTEISISSPLPAPD